MQFLVHWMQKKTCDIERMNTWFYLQNRQDEYKKKWTRKWIVIHGYQRHIAHWKPIKFCYGTRLFRYAETLLSGKQNIIDFDAKKLIKGLTIKKLHAYSIEFWEELPSYIILHILTLYAWNLPTSTVHTKTYPFNTEKFKY